LGDNAFFKIFASDKIFKPSLSCSALKELQNGLLEIKFTLAVDEKIGSKVDMASMHARHLFAKEFFEKIFFLNLSLLWQV
jgi:hypothetical protein